MDINGANKKKGIECSMPFLNSGSPTWTRTRDLRINSPSLYQLSYQGIDVAIITAACSLAQANLSAVHASQEFWLPDLDSNQGPAD
jgi:hypothetical protein